MFKRRQPMFECRCLNQHDDIQTLACVNVVSLLFVRPFLTNWCEYTLPIFETYTTLFFLKIFLFLF